MNNESKVGWDKVIDNTAWRIFLDYPQSATGQLQKIHTVFQKGIEVVVQNWLELSEFLNQKDSLVHFATNPSPHLWT